MRKLADIVVLLAVAAAFAVSLVMIRRVVGVESPWFGLMVMLDFLGLVALARRLYLLKMPVFLREARAWETKGDLYRALRVPAFGALLRGTPLRYLNHVVYLHGHPDDAPVVMAHLESAEAAHAVAAALLVPFIVIACVRGAWGAAAGLVAVEIGFNLYPMMHLRWARFRLSRLHKRKRSRPWVDESSPRPA